MLGIRATCNFPSEFVIVRLSTYSKSWPQNLVIWFSNSPLAASPSYDLNLADNTLPVTPTIEIQPRYWASYPRVLRKLGPPICQTAP